VYLFEMMKKEPFQDREKAQASHSFPINLKGKKLRHFIHNLID
jgi:hypothetical protein